MVVLGFVERLESLGRVEARRSRRTVGVGCAASAGFCFRGAGRRGSTLEAGRAAGFDAVGREEERLGVCTPLAGFSAGLGLGDGFVFTLR